MRSAAMEFELCSGLVSRRLRIEIAYIGEIVYKIHAEEVQNPQWYGYGQNTDGFADLTAKQVFGQLAEYFLGRRKVFTFKFAFEGTLFQKAVWQELLTIPYGRTASYSEIAERIGKPKAFRAVARACHDNPLPFAVPCHRVTAKDGGLGGFAFGLPIKAALLNLEQRNA